MRIEYDRHVYDGYNWVYINLPMEEIKKIAIASIKDSVMMYYSCDVGKFLNRDNGMLDIANYDCFINGGFFQYGQEGYKHMPAVLPMP